MVDTDTFSNWLKTTWFRTDKNKPNSGTILFMDRATSHLTDDILSLFKLYNCSYRLIPPRLQLIANHWILALINLSKI